MIDTVTPPTPAASGAPDAGPGTGGDSAPESPVPDVHPDTATMWWMLAEAIR